MIGLACIAYVMLFKGKTYLGDNCIQNFHLGRYIVGYTVGNFEYGYPHSNALLTFPFKNTVKMYFVAPNVQRLPAAQNRLPAAYIHLSAN